MSIHRLRLGAVCLAITLLVFTQSSGMVAADTKFDLVVTPWRFLSTAVSAWDPLSDAGTLQNQSYGYLFPMGPFFAVGHWIHLAPWVTQRTWESLLLVAAFLGVVRLSRLLGTRGFWPRVAAGLAYALAPRMLMEIGVISSELLPVVVAPWVLIPLVRGSQGGPRSSARRAAAASGVALLFAGGTNAAATLAILPIPIVWLITRERGPQRAALMRWWALAVGLASLWWAVPLVVLGKYSPPFLNWIESAAVTTSPTSLATTLRGTEHWEAYLGSGVWPTGYLFVTQRSVILGSAIVAAAGLTGITLRRTRDRLFLATCLVTGLVLATFGHVASVGPLFAHSERTALDGPLNAFRNVHKFDPVIRLPIAIGVGQIVAAGFARWGSRTVAPPTRRWWQPDPRVVAVVASLCVAIAALAPALTGNVVPETHTVNEPSWWAQTATWLGHQGDGRALVVPGAAQPIYLWGAPRDDALQPVATSAWTVRDSIPLAQAGYIRLLDEIDSDLATGQPDPALSPLLARSGIRYVVVRNDLDTTASSATPLQFLYATLRGSAGLRQVASFGPNLVTVPTPNQLIDSGATTSHAAVTVYENTGWSGNVSLLPATQAVAANGSADNLSELTAAGVTPDQPVIFAPSRLPAASGSDPLTALSDGIRKREFGFGGIGRYSATMTASQPYRTPRAAHDYLPTPSPALSTVSYLGIKNVQASSSGALATSLVNASTANGPWAAFDSDPSTAWRIGTLDGGVGQWLELDLLKAITASQATVSFAGTPGSYPDQIRVDTSSGHLDEPVTPDSAPQTISLPPGATGFVRITFLGFPGGAAGAAAGIAELSIPSVLADRTLDVPGAGRPDLIDFSVADGYRGPCLTVDGSPACDPQWATAGEEDNSLDRTFTLSQSTTYDTRAQVTLDPGTSLDQFLDRGDRLTATASSVDSHDPRQRPGAAVDGNSSTGWAASPSSLKPTLTVRTRRSHKLEAVALTALAGGATRAPVQVEITAGGTTINRNVPADGAIWLPHPVRARTVKIHVIRAALRTTTSSATGKSQFLPIGIAEVNLVGHGEPQQKAAKNLTFTCQDGLDMTVNNTFVSLHATVPLQQALSGAPFTLTPCSTPAEKALHLPPSWELLPRGSNHLSLSVDGLVKPRSFALRRVGQPTRTTPTALPVRTITWGSTSRSVGVHTRAPALLVVHENENAGWKATLNGVTLPSVTVDGWQQAWVVPAVANGVVHLTFTPQAAFAAGLIGGGGAAALLVALALPWSRRRSRRPSRAAVRGGAPHTVIRWAMIVATLTLLGSARGLVIAGVMMAVWVATPSVFRRRVSLWSLGLAFAAMIIAETARTAAARHPLAGSAGVQLVCLVAVGTALVRCLILPGRAAPRAGEPTK